MKGLQSKALTGIIWTTVGLFAQRGMTFVVSIILARLLVPEDFGLVAMVGVFIAIATGLTDMGFSSAVIQRKNLTQTDLSTIFVCNLLLACVFVGAVMAATPLIADFYGQPELKKILPYLAAGIFLTALTRIHIALLQRQIRFRAVALAALPANALGGATGVALAFMGYGVWALVFSNLVGKAASLLAYWTASRWRPSPAFSLASLKAIFPYSSRIALTGLFATIFKDVYVLIIGRLYSPADVGFYSKAHSFANMGKLTFYEIAAKVAFPLFASVQSEPQRLKAGFLKATRLTAFITLPAMATLAMVAEPLILLLIGEQWLPAAPFLAVLCLPGAAFCLAYLNFAVLKAVGRADLILRIQVLEGLMIIGGIIAFFRFGVLGLVWSQALVMLALYFIVATCAGRVIGAPLRQQLACLLPAAAMTACGAALVQGYTLLQAEPLLLDVLVRPLLAAAGFALFFFPLRRRFPVEFPFVQSLLGKALAPLRRRPNSFPPPPVG